jgi:hypothetical protein
MRKPHYLILLGLLLCQQAFGFTVPGGGYPASSIPEDLKVGANAVVRSHKTTFQVVSAGKAIETLERVVTILNARGDRFASMGVAYSKLEKVKAFEGALYSKEGKLIRKLKKSDILDHSAYDGVSFVQDNRYKKASLEHKEYPYTVVWYTQTETTNMMFYPVWMPPVSEHIAVENAQLEIICLPNLPLRHYTYGLAEPAVSTDIAGAQHYQWTANNLKVSQSEPLEAYWQSGQYVLTAPEEFEVEGYKGRMQSWEQLGAFMHQLNLGRDVLPPEAALKVKNLTAGLSDPREKVRAVYEFMQQNTRYLNISLGIGGWQPFDASYVYQKGYGDCKALSNYTKSLLKAIEIPAYYAVINAGPEKRDGVLEEFPRSYFNHVILCVPMEQDTIWLECTSQTNPFGHLGSFTGNRKALLITEEGGKLVNTRQYGAPDNFRRTKTTIDLQEEQPLYNLSRTYGGIQFDEPYEVMRIDPQYQKTWLYEHAGLPDVSLKQYQLKKDPGPEPLMHLEAHGLLQEKFSKAGNRLFVPLGTGEFPLDAPKPVAKRTTEFVQEWGYTYSDTLIYTLNNKFKPEHIPDAQSYKTAFGEYELSTAYQHGQLISTSRLILYPGRYPAAEYANWVSFVQQIRSTHASKAVLVQEP